MNRKPIRLSRSVVGPLESEAVARVLIEDGYLGMGQEVQAFEREIADFLGVPAEWVICVNSGTAALHLAVQAVTQPGDEVLVQSLTFIATFQAISAAGAVPVACEVVPETVTLDLEDVHRRLTSRSKVLMPVHYASNPGRLAEMYDLADRRGLRVIEDAAHAFGCRDHGKLIGAGGDIVCFSFDGIKNITSGEGGAIVTGDAAVAQKVRDARLLGVERDTDQRFSGQRSWEFKVQAQGYRYHLSNVLAAIGRVQLKRFPGEFAPARINRALQYRQRLADVPGLRLLDANLGELIPHIQPVRVLNSQRNALREFLGGRGIETGIHYQPNHLLALYGGGRVSLPVTERLYGELLSLPLHPLLDETDVEWICDQIKAFLGGRSEGV